MLSFPFHGHKSSNHSPPKENNTDYDNEGKMNDEKDGGVLLAKERKDRVLERIMMSDLGSFIRDVMTTSGVTRGPDASLEELKRDRAVNEVGSLANKVFMTHKEEITSWNNAYLKLKNDCNAEELNTMMEGQSHRAQLRQLVSNTGGQRYDLHDSDDTHHQTSAAHNPQGGSTVRIGRGGGVVGTRGRGAMASLGRSAPTRPASSRGLHPALDAINDYGAGLSSSKRSRKNGQENRTSVRGSTIPGRGIGHHGMRQDLRASIVGTTVQVTATTTRLAQARQPALNSRWAPASLARNPTPKEVAETNRPSSGKLRPVLQSNPQYDLLLNPKAFLAAVAGTKDRETFNKMIPAQLKPSPASGTAECFVESPNKVEKTFNEFIQYVARPSLLPKAAEKITELNLLKNAQKMSKGQDVGNLKPGNPKSEQLRPRISQAEKPTSNRSETKRPKVDVPELVKRTQEQEYLRRQGECQAIRQMPIHEAILRPAVLKSTPLCVDASACTNELPSPGMLNFLGSSDHTPVIGSADRIEEGKDMEITGPPSSTCENVVPVADLGISDSPTAVSEPRANLDWDLLMLGTDETVQQLSSGQGMDASLTQDVQVSGAVADLMDLDFGVVPQDVLIPDASKREQEIEPEANREPKPELVKSPAALTETPACINLGGFRYFREDQLPRATSPGTATANRLKVPLFPTPAATDRVFTGTGYNIGDHHLGSHDDTLFEELSLTRRAQDSLNPSTIHSIWAESPPVPAGKRRIRAMSPVQVQTEPKLERLLQTSLPLDAKPKSHGEYNLPGSSQLIAPEDTPNMSKGYSHVERSNMPHEANPWGTSHSIVATTRTSDLDGSQWGVPIERVPKHLSKSKPNGLPATRSVDRPSKMTASGLSENSIFGLPQPSRSSQNQLGSSTPEDVAIFDVELIKSPVKQHLVSMRQPVSCKLVVPSSSTTEQHETLEQRMVRMMNSRGPTGMTPLTTEPRATETRQTHDSILSASHSRGSSRSQSNLSKPNLSSSKWAAEDAGSSLTKTNRSANQEGSNRGVLNENESNNQFMPQGGKTNKGIVRTNAGPGLALLTADADAPFTTAKVQGKKEAASAASSNDLPVTGLAPTACPTAQAANPTTCTASEASLSVAAHIKSESRTNQSLSNRSPTSRLNLVSEPRIRVVNRTRGLGPSQELATIKHGGTSFRQRWKNEVDVSSDESEL